MRLFLLLGLAILSGGCLGRRPLVWVTSQVVPAQVAEGMALAEAFSRRTDVPVLYKHGIGRQELAEMLARGESVDVLTLSSAELGSSAAQGLLVPLGDLPRQNLSQEKQEFYSTGLEAGKVGEQLYGLPICVDVPVVYYNREILRRLKARPPAGRWEWGDYLERAKALTRDLDGDGVPDVYGVYCHGELDTLLAQEGVQIFSYGEDQKAAQSALNGAALRDVLEFYLDLKEELQVCPPRVAQGDPVRSFSAGEVAMLTASITWAGEIAAATDFDWDLAPVPAPQRGKRYHSLGVSLLAVPRACHNQDQAGRFIEFACRWQGLSGTGGIPAAKAVAQSEQFLKAFPPGVEKVVADLGGFLPPRNGQEVDFLRTIWYEEVGKLLKGQQSLDDTLSELERRGNEMVGSRGAVGPS